MNAFILGFILSFWMTLQVFAKEEVEAPSVAIIPGWARIAEQGQVRQIVLEHKKHKMSFIPLSGWHFATNSNRPKVTLSAKDYSAAIAVEIVSPKEQLESYFDGKVVDRLLFFAADTDGEGIDYEKTINPKTKLAGRVALFKFEHAAILVHMTCKLEAFDRMERSFKIFASSLHLEEKTD